MKREVHKLLQELRFTEYEARVYLALLEKAPLTGYGAALHSGVPRSKIYEVLGSLVSRGDVVSSQEETPLYLPLPPAELIARRRRESERVLEEADRALKSYAGFPLGKESIWNISGREAIMDRVRAGLKTAKRRVLLDIWPEEALELREDLKALVERGVEVIVATDTDPGLDFLQVYTHENQYDFTEEYGGRWVVMSVDDREVVAGIVSLGEQSRAAWSTHPGLVMPITEYVIHDLYVLEMLHAFRPELEARFGRNLEKLRKKFSDNLHAKRYYQGRELSGK